MRMPEDFDDRSNFTPSVIKAMALVTAFVALILILVLILNHNGGKRNDTPPKDGIQAASGPASPVVTDSDMEEYLSGSNLRPEDLDFWEMYPKATVKPQTTEEPQEEEEEEDPSADGKHTLVKYGDGEEEWVLISPYLPKHEYDFTRLVCQSDLMKYYENGKKISYVGADISKFQDYVDFVKLKKAGIEFVMLRLGARGYGTGQLILDDYFVDNIKRATDAGLEVGVYFYSQAISVEEAVEEANMVLENLGEYRISYPVAFDMELVENDTARTDALTRAERTEITKAFLDTVGAAGYKTMIYGNKEWLIKEIDMSKLTAYDVWLSQDEDIPDYPYKFAMWQYEFEGTVDGIAGYVNLNISFINYAEK